MLFNWCERPNVNISILRIIQTKKIIEYFKKQILNVFKNKNHSSIFLTKLLFKNDWAHMVQGLTMAGYSTGKLHVFISRNSQPYKGWDRNIWSASHSAHLSGGVLLSTVDRTDTALPIYGKSDNRLSLGMYKGVLQNMGKAKLNYQL